MSDDFIQFRYILSQADEQLQWGTDPERVEVVAAELRRSSPSSVLVNLLKRKAARLRENLRSAGVRADHTATTTPTPLKPQE